MVLIALVSAKGSPGVTTAGLALTLTWPGRCVLAECDPAGGSVQAGYLAGALPAGRGIGELAVAALRGADLHQAWWGQLVDLQDPFRQRLLLPGIADPAQSGALRPTWGQLAGFFAGLEHQEGLWYDVLADCGRLTVPNAPWPLLSAASLVLVVLSASLPQVAAAVPVVRALHRHLAEQDGGGKLGLLLTGGGDQRPRAVAEQLRLPVVASLPTDARSARALSHGGSVRLSWPLMRAAAAAHYHITRQVQRHATDAMPPAGAVATRDS
jgi:hypothetical protein